MDGVTLREIIDVKVDSESRRAVTISRATDDIIINTMEGVCLAIDVLGENGAAVRVARFHEGRKEFNLRL